MIIKNESVFGEKTMTYEAAVQYIHSLLKFGIQPGLERITELLAELGNPQAEMRFVHVAGTNGKGTTSTMLSEILSAAGHKTGLFTSPYVFDFCERIRVNGESIPHKRLAEIVETVQGAVDLLKKRGVEPTEFEAVTASALLYFKQERCDFAVLEVGIGGRLDSTNAIPCPAAAVITSVSLDHTQILGDTIEQIAYEKSGIIKTGGTVVTTTAQDKAALAVIEKTAGEKAARLIVGDVEQAAVSGKTLAGMDLDYNGLSVHIPLAGGHQVENAVGVIEAARTLGIPDSLIRQGIERTVIRGRMEFVPGLPPMLLDGGHNPECAAALNRLLLDFAADYKITVLLGMMADKDCEKYISEILPLCCRAVVTMPKNPRAAKAQTLAQIAGKFLQNLTVEENPKYALETAKQMTGENGLLLVCGSFYLLSDIFHN